MTASPMVVDFVVDGARLQRVFSADIAAPQPPIEYAAADLTISLPPAGTPNIAQHVRVQERGGLPCPLPPFDSETCPEMAFRKFATVNIGYEVYESPFGAFRCVERFVDGKLTGSDGPDVDPDLTVRMSYLTLLRFRARKLELLEAVLESQVIGSEPFVNLAGALAGDEAYLTHVSRRPALLEALINWMQYSGGVGNVA